MEYNLTTFPTYSIASITRKGERIVTIRISVDIHEKTTTHGHATALMYSEALLSGCAEYSRSEFQDAMSMLGGRIAVDVANGFCNISLEVRKENAERLFELFVCMMQSPRFAPNDFKRIRTLRINELREEKENARDTAHRNLTNTLFTPSDRRYEPSPDDTIAEIPKITKKDLVTFHTRVMSAFWFSTIGANSSIVQSFTDTLESLKQQNVQLLYPVHEPKKSKRSCVFTSIPSKQNVEFSIGGPLPLTLHHPDYHPFLFGINVLGKWGGFTGRLMSTVREKEGLTYGIYARTENVLGDEVGNWRIMTFFAPSQAETGLTSTLRELKAIARDGITKSEFSRFKTILSTQQQLLSDSLLRSVAELHGYHKAGFTLDEMRNHKEQLLHVTHKAVNEALRKYLDPNLVVVSCAGPIDTIKNKLSKVR